MSCRLKTELSLLQKNDFNFFLKDTNSTSDLIAIGNAFHRLVIQMKKELQRRDALAVLLMRKSPEDPQWGRPLQK